jgi:hypothetical protein
MSQSIHTPGPWLSTFYPRSGTKHLAETQIVGGGNKKVVSIFGESDESIANARLIALTPEMFEELQTLRRCCLEALNGDWDRGDDGFVAMLESIDALLGKATAQ